MKKTSRGASRASDPSKAPKPSRTREARRTAGSENPLRGRAVTPALLAETIAHANRPLKLDDFMRILALPRKEKRAVEAALAELAASGTAARLTGGAYALSSSLKTVTGVLHIQRSGIGFVLPDAPSHPPRKRGSSESQSNDIFISAHHTGDAWHGDRVAVTLYPDRHGKNREGRVTAVLERARKTIAARVLRNQRDGTALCEAIDSRIDAMFLADVSTLEDKPSREAVLMLALGERKGADLWNASVIEVMGDEYSPKVQEELAKAGHLIPDAFPPDALAEAQAFPQDPQTDGITDRRDLTSRPLVTIDGETARDFDDAIHVVRTKTGFTLTVAIADVAHYVRPGSALDTEAYLRGNSYYFPNSVAPMLPEALSNGLCSLNPDVPRLAMVAEIPFSPNGVPGKATFYPAVIKSAARLTYTQVQAALDATPDTETSQNTASGAISPRIFAMLEDAATLARILIDERVSRGSLDFEIPEPEYVVTDGVLENIVPRRTLFAHKLIEAFMVAANEAVARFLQEKHVPFLYRAHPAPDLDKLQTLFTSLAASGLAHARKPSPDGKKHAPLAPRELQSILKEARGTPGEYVVSRLVLRTMMQAGYTPEADGHFGLASSCYCHFTSPIRRYADLVVHRALKHALASPDKTPVPDFTALTRIAEHINATERTAMEAEREVAQRFAALFMHSRIGEEYEGVVASILESAGMFVELTTVMAGGLLPFSGLPKDYYLYYPERQQLRGERTGLVFRMGQKLTVRVDHVSLARLEIDLALAHDSPVQTAAPIRPTKGKRRRK